MNIATLLQNPAIISEVTRTLKANPQLALNILKMAAPELVTHLDTIRDALYRGTTKEEQIFISQNIGSLSGFLNTKSGAAATSVFIAEWQEHIIPPKPKEPEPEKPTE